MTPTELEALADRALKGLPPPRAPHTLVPRAMSAVHVWAARPWYSRTWLTWPLAWQVVSVGVLVLIVSGAALIAPRVESATVAVYAAVQSRVIGGVPDMAPPVEATTSGAVILWRTLIEPLATYALGVIVLMCLACAVFGTALNHVVIEKAEQR